VHYSIAKTMSVSLVVVAVGTSAAMSQRPASEHLLPETTKAFVTTRNCPELVKRWEQTQFGQLVNDPQLRPFLDELRSAPGAPWLYINQTMGVSFEDLRTVTTGELSVALVRLDNDRCGTVVLADVRGEDLHAVDALIAKIHDRLQQKGAQLAQLEVAGVSATMFELKTANGEVTRTVYFIKEGLFAVADDAELAEGVLKRWSGDRSESLSAVPAFRQIMDRCAFQAAGLVPDLRWFVEPVGLIRLGYEPDPDREGRDDPERFAAKHGFDAVEGIGGFVNFKVDGFDVLHRTLVNLHKPYESSMQMFEFLPGARSDPLPWISSNVSSYTVLNLDIVKAFDHCADLFDDLIGEGVEGTFDAIIDDLKAPDGPQVDMRSDLIEHLGTHVISMGCYIAPVSETSEGTILAIEASDERKVANAVKYLLRDDPAVHRMRVEGFSHDLWKVGEDLSPMEADGGPLFSSLGLMVAHGHLLIATDIQFLRGLLYRRIDDGSLADDNRFRDAIGKLGSLGDDRAWMKMIAYLDRDFFTTYELLRQGSLHKAASIYASAVRVLLEFIEGEGAERSAIDFGTLPTFGDIKRYLGISAIVASDDEVGWLVEGFIMPKTP
jgi:hypothetical protein